MMGSTTKSISNNSAEGRIRSSVQQDGKYYNMRQYKTGEVNTNSLSNNKRVASNKLLSLASNMSNFSEQLRNNLKELKNFMSGTSQEDEDSFYCISIEFINFLTQLRLNLMKASMIVQNNQYSRRYSLPRHGAQSHPIFKLYSPHILTQIDEIYFKVYNDQNYEACKFIIKRLSDNNGNNDTMNEFGGMTGINEAIDNAHTFLQQYPYIDDYFTPDFGMKVNIRISHNHNANYLPDGQININYGQSSARSGLSNEYSNVNLLPFAGKRVRNSNSTTSIDQKTTSNTNYQNSPSTYSGNRNISTKSGHFMPESTPLNTNKTKIHYHLNPKSSLQKNIKLERANVTQSQATKLYPTIKSENMPSKKSNCSENNDNSICNNRITSSCQFNQDDKENNDPRQAPISSLHNSQQPQQISIKKEPNGRRRSLSNPNFNNCKQSNYNNNISPYYQTENDSNNVFLHFQNEIDSLSYERICAMRSTQLQKLQLSLSKLLTNIGTEMVKRQS